MTQEKDLKGLFIDSMSRLAGGVSVVTTEIDDRPWGLTISACSSISVDPQIIMISLAKNTVSAQGILESQKFGVSILSKNQTDIAKYASKPGETKFIDQYIDERQVNNQVYALKDSLAHIDCTVYKEVVAGDHIIFLGQVNNVILNEPNDALVHFSREFHTTQLN